MFVLFVLGFNASLTLFQSYCDGGIHVPSSRSYREIRAPNKSRILILIMSFSLDETVQTNGQT